MPQGPFGFNRPFGVGPLVSESFEGEDPQELFMSLSLRSHSLRNYDPREFRYLKRQGIPQPDLREELRVIESGRFEPILKETHRMFVHLDEDERQDFASNNPGIMDWVNAWAELEEQITFEEYI